MREPTPDECTTHAKVTLTDTLTGHACWYPKMGGYVGKAVAVLFDGCVDVYVWHDGEFPFSDGSPDAWGDPRSPVKLHHCDGGQFIQFGQFLEALQDGADVTREPLAVVKLDEDLP